jgi:NAD(P)-dependent dehydrogenase (short-subunit alcohol dehydrogenase family)
LAGKVALVDGAGSRGASEGRVGTGRAISVLLAREGATVGLMDIDPARARETQTAIEAEGGESLILEGDAVDEGDCARIVGELVDRYGSLDILINNVVAWRGATTAITDLDAELWDHQMSLGLKSVVLMCKHAIPAMAASGGGSIISIASVAGMLAHGTPAYGAAKAGMIMLTRDIAFQYGRDGIRANVISPGHIYVDDPDGPASPLRDWRRDVAPLGIEGTAWDVAWAAVFLASDESRFISGLNVPVDGGVTQMAPFMARSDLIGGDSYVEGMDRRPRFRAEVAEREPLGQQ